MKSVVIAALFLFIGILIADSFVSNPCVSEPAANPGKGGGKKTGQ